MLATLLAVTATVQEQVYDVGEDVTTPVAIKIVHAPQTPGAMRDKVQGWVTLRAVVLTDGRVGDVAVTEALHPDLDGS